MDKREIIAALLERGRTIHNLHESARAQRAIIQLIGPADEAETDDLLEIIARYMSGESLFSAQEATDALIERHPEE